MNPSQDEMEGATLRQRDRDLKQRLESLSENDAEFWSFKDNDAREHTHVYFQYPAMMVPQMQGELIQAVRQVDPEVRCVLDPFVGSGTILAEAMMRGLDFAGQDVNPLAVLVCRAKAGPFDDEAMREQATRLLEAIREDRCDHIEADFPGRDKWFRHDVQLALSCIRRGIRMTERTDHRRFFWVALAETVRVTSNSRTSTYKLHTRPVPEIEARELDPIATFATILCRNITNMAKQRAVLAQNAWLVDGHYCGEIRIRLGDSIVEPPPVANADAADLLVTSPPYGDNQTTVPYGQHSYLPLQWIDREDVDHGFNAGYLSNTHTIDGRSLGGSRKNAIKDSVHLMDLSPTFKRTLEALDNEPIDRRSRVAAFCRDLDRCIDPILRQLRPDAYMIWTTGNRKVGDRPVPMNHILTELLLARHAEPVVSLDRKILSKRMPHKNSIASTMGAETILVLRKGGS